MGTGSWLREEVIQRPLPLHVVSMGYCAPTAALLGRSAAGSGNMTSGNGTALRVYYMPLSMSARFTVARFMIANGSSVSGNVDLGLYDNAGSKLISTGSTARSGTSVAQYIGVTDQSFPPGQYYLAMVLSATTSVLRYTINAAANTRMTGALQETIGALPLPSSMTPVAYTETTLYWFGFTQSDTL